MHNRHPALRVSAREVSALIQALDAASEEPPQGRRKAFSWRAPPGEISVAILTDSEIARLHGAFLQDPTPTDVITFPGNAAFGQAGEICVSADTARAYAERHGLDPAGELTLYIIHGYLHLAGLDDRTPPHKRRMRQAESAARELLGQPRLTLSRRAVRRPKRA